MKGFIDGDVQERLSKHVAELLENLDRNVCLKSDRAFIDRVSRLMDPDTMSHRRLTVAEADQIGVIYGNYWAYVKNKHHRGNGLNDRKRS